MKESANYNNMTMSNLIAIANNSNLFGALKKEEQDLLVKLITYYAKNEINEFAYKLTKEKEERNNRRVAYYPQAYER